MVPIRPLVREYTRLAPRYDRRWARYVAASTDATLARLPELERARLLDLGCGTGVLLAGLAERDPDAALLGLDLTPAMLRRAADRLAGRAELLCATAERIPLSDASVDALASVNTFHFFERPEAALAEMARVLRPGGRLVVTDWCGDFLACRLLGASLRLLRRPVARIWGSADFRAALERAGFDAVAVERYRIGWFWGQMTATARRGR